MPFSRQQTRQSLLACGVAAIASLGCVAMAQAPAESEAPKVGDHLKGVDSKQYRIDQNKRDFAEVTFSVDSDVEHFVKYPNGAYVKWTKKVRFDGKARLKYAYGGGIYTTGALDDLEDLPAFAEAQYIAEGWKACETETDVVKMGQCTAAATMAGEAKAKRCRDIPAAAREAQGCGGGSSAPPRGMYDVLGPNRDADRYDETPEGDLRAWEAMTCIGRTKVNGKGEGVDPSSSTPGYTLSITGEYETADPTKPGGTQGCWAGATIDVKTGEVRLMLRPSPRNIVTRTTYSDFRGSSKAPFPTFEELEGLRDGIVIDLKIAPGAKTFQGAWRPPRKPGVSSDAPGVMHKVQTLVNYHFESE